MFFSFTTSLSLCFILCSSFLFGQSLKPSFILPLDREPIVTGNYGELRPNHFHAGIDFRTDQIQNLPIKSVADGYISRIKISRGGYGNVLYITHANGYVTVYAHQKKFADKIDTYIKEVQIDQQKNEIEVYPEKNVLVVKQGEVIGFTGNSGSSSGPHLHFEIRDEKLEVPLNPLLFYTIKDDVKPELNQFAIYNVVDTLQENLYSVLPIKNTKGALALSQPTLTLPFNAIALGFSGFDMANGTMNKNNIYEVKIYLDNKLIYHHQLNHISFDDTRYVNVFSERIKYNKIQKCFTPSCYQISIYKTILQGGKIYLNDTLTHQINLVVADEKGNSNYLNFYIKTNNLQYYSTKKPLINVTCDKDTLLKKEFVEALIKKGTFSKPCFIASYINKLGHVVVGSANDQLLKPATISIKVAQPVIGKESRMVMMLDNRCVGGTYSNGWLKAETKSLGAFSISYDTIAPTILLKAKNRGNLSHHQTLIFKVGDNLSGINDYHLYINNVWTIVEYDSKTGLITYNFNNSTRGELLIKLILSDNAGNINTLEFKTER